MSSKKILIVDEDPADLKLITEMVKELGIEILTAATGQEALRVIASEEPRIVITDLTMPEMNGLQLCETLRRHEGIRFIYIIVVTGRGSGKMIEAFNAGADDFLTKPLNKDELLVRLRAADRIVCMESDLAKRTREVHRTNAEMAVAHKQLNRANERLREMATTDELTSLLNRREAMSRLSELWAARDRYDQNFSCIMVDIDHFKSFNDLHGHAAGDEVLKETAELFMKNIRQTDNACRIGGEEFLILCSNVGVDGAAVCAEKLRVEIEEHAYMYHHEELKVTVSLGVAEPTPDMEGPDDLLKAADKALYRSKDLGRNRVTVAEGSVVSGPR
ncbi:MAG: diguanylate cyclase [Phycisphaerales bacterium]|nr:diguanylate cyclase [Phycisphaerales bacterium]